MKSSKVILMKKLFALAIVLMIAVNESSAQDTKFSQYYTLMPAINPASTGAFGGDYRFLIDYRRSNYSASVDAFNTVYASYDQGIAKYRSDGEDRQSYFGIGLSLLNDKAGTSSLGLMQINALLSYNLKMGEFSWLSLGTRIGYATRSVDYTNLTWGSQFNDADGSYDPSAFSDPLAQYEKATYVPVSIGLIYNLSKIDKLKMNAGLALENVNKPNAAFDGEVKEELPMKTNIHVGAEWMIPNTIMALMPHVLFTTGGHYSETNFGVILKTYLSFDSKSTHIKKSSSLYTGIFYRTSKDLILLMKFDLRRNIALGLSYDIDLSAVSDPLSKKKRSALEFVITYSSFFKERRLIPRKGSTEFF